MPLYTLLYLNKLYRICKNVRLNASQLEEIQCRRFKNLIDHAYNNVSYYRKLFTRTGISTADIKTSSDISKIPITAKSQVQALSKEEITIKGRDIKKCLNLKTSGSTGEPLNIFLTEEESITSGLFYIRMQLENGYRITDRMVCITDPQYIKKRKRWFQYLGVVDVEYISCFEDIEQQVRKISKIKPQIINCTAHNKACWLVSTFNTLKICSPNI